MLGTLLVATICLADQKTFECKEPPRDISAAVDMSVKECQTRAQSLLPQMLEAFPNNVVKRYKCVEDNGKKKIDI